MSSSVVSDPFLCLSVELVCEILGFLDSPKDLFSVLHASRYVYDTYKVSQDHVLLKIAQNGFKLTALSTAIAAIRFPDPDTGSIPIHQYSASRKHQQHFALLQSLLDESQRGTQAGARVEESLKLCSLLSAFEAFSRDFANQALAKAEREVARKSDPEARRNLIPGLLQEPVFLSDTEIARLQRAFVRYTIFQRLIKWRPKSSDLDHDYRTQLSVKSLFNYFTPWEVEEISCVYEYVMRWLERVHNEAQNDFIQSVISAERSSKARSEAQAEETLEPSESGTTESLYYKGCNKRHSALIFDDCWSYIWPDVAEKLALNPFWWLHELIEADNLERAVILEGSYDYVSHSFGSELNNGAPPDGRQFPDIYQAWLAGRVASFDGDKPRTCNFAWLWAHQMRPYPGFGDSCDTDLRAWGYVFWDKDRLDRMGLLEYPRPVRPSHVCPDDYWVTQPDSAETQLNQMERAGIFDDAMLFSDGDALDDPSIEV